MIHRVFAYAELAALIIFLVLIVTKVAMLRMKNINAVAVGRGKSGFLLASELFSFAMLGVWAFIVLLYAFGDNFRLPYDVTLLHQHDSLPQVIGVLLISIAIVFFASAFFSFGN